MKLIISDKTSTDRSLMMEKYASLVFWIWVCAGLLTACEYQRPPYTIQQPGLLYEPTPSLRADELVQRAASGPAGHKVVNTGDGDGRYSAEAIVIKEYQRDGRACKDVHKKTRFEQKITENQDVPVCYFQGANPGWFIMEKTHPARPDHDYYLNNLASQSRPIPVIAPIWPNPYWRFPSAGYPPRSPWLPPRY
jgi:hypothetical protein